MPERKTAAVNLRMTIAVKELLRMAAEREHRTLSNMLEHLVLKHCELEGIELAAASEPSSPPLPGKQHSAKRPKKTA